MKIVSYLQHGHENAGFYLKDRIFPFAHLYEKLPVTMAVLLKQWDTWIGDLKKLWTGLQQGDLDRHYGIDPGEVTLLAPVPHPTSCRDGYAFRQHVATARRNRGLPMIPEFDQFPVFYFTNHNSITGPGDILCMPDHFRQLDFELEAAIVICRKGRNITADKADEYIGGLMIMNDMSARKLQMEEMKLNLGPAKGKDFATATGPWLVTLDELEAFETAPPKGHRGKSWNLNMHCWVNGELVSQGNLSQMSWTFAEIIERVSYGVDIYPGDIIGSGTVGTGCFLELNGTARLADPGFKDQWLAAGDHIRMEMAGLGVLENKLIADDCKFSILELQSLSPDVPSARRF
ncbi:fumarylacetoacetate hydrolase family protein [Niabella terrae]